MSIILLVIPIVGSPALAVVTTMVRDLKYEVSYSSDNKICQSTGLNQEVGDYIVLGTGVLAALFALFLVIMCKAGYETAQKFLGTALAVFFMTMITVFIDIFYYYIHTHYESFGYRVMMTVKWLRHAMPGWVGLFWLLDSGIGRSLCFCRPPPPEPPQRETPENMPAVVQCHCKCILESSLC